MDQSKKALKDLRALIPWSRQFAIWGVVTWLRDLDKGERMELVKKLLIYIGTLKILDGYRMYIGGAGIMLTGIGTLLVELNKLDANDAIVSAAFGAIGYGFKVIGEAGKHDKQIAATNGNTIVTAAADPGVNSVTAEDAEAVIANLPSPVAVPVKEVPVGSAMPGPSEH